MKMKIAFSRVPKEYEDWDTYFVGVGQDGKDQNYYYMLEFDDEGDGNGTFKIVDGCDREMPFDYESLDELVEVLVTLKKYRDEKQQLERYWQNRWGQRAQSLT